MMGNQEVSSFCFLMYLPMLIVFQGDMAFRVSPNNVSQAFETGKIILFSQCHVTNDRVNELATYTWPLMQSGSIGKLMGGI